VIETPRRVGTFSWPPAETTTWPLTPPPPLGVSSCSTPSPTQTRPGARLLSTQRDAENATVVPGICKDWLGLREEYQKPAVVELVPS